MLLMILVAFVALCLGIVGVRKRELEKAVRATLFIGQLCGVVVLWKLYSNTGLPGLLGYHIIDTAAIVKVKEGILVIGSIFMADTGFKVGRFIGDLNSQRLRRLR